MTEHKKKSRSSSPPPSSVMMKEEEGADYEEEESMEEEMDQKMLKLLEKSVAAIDALRKEQKSLRKELDAVKQKDDYPEVVDAPGEGVDAEAEVDHDATEEEESAEVSEEASVMPVSDNVDTADAFTGKSVTDLVEKAVSAALEKQAAEFNDRIAAVASSTPRPLAFTKKSDEGLRAIINKAVAVDREACGVHSQLGSTEVFGFKSGRGDEAARRQTARWMTKMQEGGN